MSKIIWKGIDSDSIKGLLISELPPISKPKMKTTITKIDGRDGDVIEELGYESYIKTLKIGLTKDYDLLEKLGDDLGVFYSENARTFPHLTAALSYEYRLDVLVCIDRLLSGGGSVL